MAEELSRASIIDHLKELRSRVIRSCLVAIVASVVVYFFYDQLIAVLSAPLASVKTASGSEKLFFITSLFEGFMVKFKFSMIGGVILSLPFHVYQILRFILPGLKNKERRLIRYALVASAFLSVFSLYLCYFVVIPSSARFLMSADFIPKNVGIMLRFGQNLDYVFHFLLYTMLVFQFPIVLEILLYLNVITRKTLLAYARFVIVLIFIVAAFITAGADVISQIGIAVPLVILFYLTILMAKIFGWGESV